MGTNSSGNYVDLATGKPLTKDPKTGLYVDEAGRPVEFFVDINSKDTFYSRTGQNVNNALVQEHGKWKIGNTKIVSEGDEMKIRTPNGRVKVENDEAKAKDVNTKLKVEDDGIKMKGKDSKLKTDDDQMKAKGPHGKEKIDGDDYKKKTEDGKIKAEDDEMKIKRK